MGFFTSSIGKKVVMAITGIAMCLFLAGHLTGNMLLYVGRDAFNNYADFLASLGTILYVVEFSLIAILVAHIYTAILLTRENDKANPQKYAIKTSGGMRTWASSHMIHSGMVTFLFIVFHIYSFKFGNWDNTEGSAVTLYDLVVKSFADPIYSGGYIICMILIGFHLHHAVKSSSITLGITNSGTVKSMEKFSLIFTVVITLGFISFPAYFYTSCQLSTC